MEPSPQYQSLEPIQFNSFTDSSQPEQMPSTNELENVVIWSPSQTVPENDNPQSSIQSTFINLFL